MRVVALCLFLTLAAPAQTAKPEEFSTIEGRVLNSVTGEPVGKVSLLLIRTDAGHASSDGTRDYDATSDAAGKFAIRTVDPGTYRLRATRNGFVTLEYGARSSQRTGSVLDLNLPQPLKDVELRLTPQGVIAGRVLDADGEPMERAQVQLLRSQYVNGKKTLSTTSTTSTNDLGEYRWSGLTPGKYFIYAEDFEGLPPATVAREQYVPVYYPGAVSAAGAIPLVVTAGAQLRVMDVMLRKAPTVTVKGRVVIELPDVQGTPSVRFFPGAGYDDSAGSVRSPAAKVNAAGEFEIRSLTPGSYTVMAQIANGGLFGPNGRTTVDVAANMEGVVVTIGSGVSMTGRIRVEGDATPDFKSPSSLRLEPGGPGSGTGGWTYPVAPDHTFKMENVDPNRYGIVLEGLPDGFYVKSVRVGATDVLYSGVELTTGAAGPVDILLSPKAGLVSGAAQNPKTSQPVPGATVVLIPQEKERLAISAFWQDATTDQSGRFTFKNVAPGDYKVYAWEDVESGAWLDPDFMKPLEAKGESVSVAESAQASVQVNIIPAD